LFVSANSTCTRVATNTWPLARWGGSVALLAAEVLGLTVHYDAEVLVGRDGWLTGVVQQSSMAANLIFTIAIATLLISAARPSRTNTEVCDPPRHMWILLLAHAAIFASFAWVTSWVMDPLRSASPPAGWIVAWLIFGLANLVSWAAVLLPVPAWVRLSRGGGRTLLAGMAVGGVGWGVSRLAAALWEPLGRSTLWVVLGCLGLISRDLRLQPDEMVVGLTQFSVAIAPQCSGYEGIGLTVYFLGAYLWFFRADLRFPNALLLLPAGVAVIWTANALRIVALILIGAWWSPTVARGGFHSQAGWLLFNTMGLGLIAVSRRSRFFTRSESDAVAKTNPAVPYLAPFMALVAATMVTAALTAGFDWLYPVRVVAVGLVLWACWGRRLGRLWTGWSWPSIAAGVGVFALWIVLEPASLRWATTSSWLPPDLAAAPRALTAIWVGFRVLGSVVTVPLAEELAFRGYLPRRIISTDFESVPPERFTWLSFMASSALFGALHSRWFAGTVAGMVYALVVCRSGKVADAVVAHAVTNALIAAYVLSTGSWTMWS
jgi:exosortase E/protease (VPEID-CTERM system)